MFNIVILLCISFFSFANLSFASNSSSDSREVNTQSQSLTGIVNAPSDVAINNNSSNLSKKFKIRGSISLGAMYNDNVNNSPTNGIMEVFFQNIKINAKVKEKKDYASFLFTNTTYQKYIGKNYGFLGSTSLSIQDYFKLDNRDALTFFTRNGITKYLNKKTLVYIPIVFNASRIDSTFSSPIFLFGSYGIAPSVSYKVGLFNLSNEVSFMRRKWASDFKGSNYIGRNSDILSVTPSVSFGYKFFNTNLSYIFRREVASFAAFSNSINGLSLFSGLSLPKYRSSIFASASYLNQAYDGKDYLTNKARTDKILNITSGYSLVLNKVVSLNFNHSFNRTKSSVSNFTYTQNQYNLGLSLRFS